MDLNKGGGLCRLNIMLKAHVNSLDPDIKLRYRRIPVPVPCVSSSLLGTLQLKSQSGPQ